jgi:hypothetical protein
MTVVSASMEIQPGKPFGDFVPLSMAVRLVYAELYRRAEQPATHERLDGLAQALTVFIPVYTNSRGDIEPRRLAFEEFAGGMMRLGGKAIHFVDGRTPIDALYVTRTGIEHVKGLLQDISADDETSAVPPN